jgi:hypothetical protein
MVGGWSSGTRSSSASSPRASAFFVMHQMSDSMVTIVRLSGLANRGRWLLRSPVKSSGESDGIERTPGPCVVTWSTGVSSRYDRDRAVTLRPPLPMRDRFPRPGGHIGSRPIHQTTH